MQLLTARFQVRDTVNFCDSTDQRTSPGCSGQKGNTTSLRIIYAGGHGHAPSRINLALYNRDTGALCCRQAPLLGTTPSVTLRQRGYIAILLRLWSRDARCGLLAPPFLSYDTNRTSIERNNTFAHVGGRDGSVADEGARVS